MPDQKILAQFDRTGAIGVQIIVSIFMALIVVVSLVFGVTLTAFILCWCVARKALILVLSRRETVAVFSLVGTRL